MAAAVAVGSVARVAVPYWWTAADECANDVVRDVSAGEDGSFILVELVRPPGPQTIALPIASVSVVSLRDKETGRAVAHVSRAIRVIRSEPRSKDTPRHKSKVEHVDMLPQATTIDHSHEAVSWMSDGRPLLLSFVTTLVAYQRGTELACAGGKWTATQTVH
jgi:hypothetical protein